MRARSYEETDALGIGARTVPYVPEEARTGSAMRAATIGLGVMALLRLGWGLVRRARR